MQLTGILQIGSYEKVKEFLGQYDPCWTSDMRVLDAVTVIKVTSQTIHGPMNFSC